MLIDPAYVKQRFPLWETYAAHAANADPEGVQRTPEEVLSQTIEDAEAEMSSYVHVPDAEALTPALRYHLLRLVKKHLFDLKHGNSNWGEDEGPPQIVKDYYAARKALRRYRDGETAAPGEEPRGLNVSAPQRRFSSADGERSDWFTRH